MSLFDTITGAGLLLSTIVAGVSGLVLDGPTNNDLMSLYVKLEAEVEALRGQLNEIQPTCNVCPALTKPPPTPAFMATLTTSIDSCLVNNPVIFDSVRLNNANAYDPRHGMFRAPRNGTYHFAVTLADAPHKGFHVKLVRNSPTDEIGYLFADGNYDGWLERSTSVVVHLNAGDDVWLACSMPSSLTGGNTGREHDYHSHFSGFMISED